MDLDEGVCAACGKPLGPRANWRIANEGRAYHLDCEPSPKREAQDLANVESLGEYAERKFRGVMYGKGQQQLREEDGD